MVLILGSSPTAAHLGAMLEVMGVREWAILADKAWGSVPTETGVRASPSHLPGSSPDPVFGQRVSQVVRAALAMRSWDTVLTHGASGEYGHVMHWEAHRLVLSSVVLHDVAARQRELQAGQQPVRPLLGRLRCARLWCAGGKSARASASASMRECAPRPSAPSWEKRKAYSSSLQLIETEA